jgi:ABC-type spermidine/putrescine transport system permease subunit II
MLGTPQALVLAHATMAVPFVLLITGAAITRIPPELERAAMSLGAGRLRAWRDITLPILAPALLSSAIFAFITSFDEAVVSSFLGYETLPVAIFNSVRYGVDPVIMAIATLLTLTTGGLLAVSVLLRRSK